MFPAVVLLLKYKPVWSPRVKHIIINQAWMTIDSKQDTAFTVFVQQKLQSTRNKMTGGELSKETNKGPGVIMQRHKACEKA